MHSHCQNKIGNRGVGVRFQGYTLFHTLSPLPHTHCYIHLRSGGALVFKLDIIIVKKKKKSRN